MFTRPTLTLTIQTFAAASALFLTSSCSSPKRLNAPEANQTAFQDQQDPTTDATHCDFKTRYVIIAGKGKTLRLDALDSLARDFISRKDEKFPPPRMSLLVSIDRKNQTRFVVLDYQGDIGKSCWRICIDVNGRITSFETGVLRFD
jgi:hypothetical protein